MENTKVGMAQERKGGPSPDTGSPADAGLRPSGASQTWIFLDVCKVVAVFLIVMMHVSAGAWGASTLGSFPWHSLNVFYCLSRIGMPLFFMQVGAVFLNEQNEISTRTLYSKYILRIVTAFFFWSAFYWITYYWLDVPGGFAQFDLLTFVTGFFSGAPYSQWFILLAISLYLIIPILRPVARQTNTCRYFLVLWAVFSILLPTVYRLPTLIPAMPASLQEGLHFAADTVSRVTPSMVIEFPGYMMLGYFLHKTQLTKKGTLTLSLLGLGGLLYTILMTAHISLRDGASTEVLFGNFSINICLTAVGAMVGIKYLMQKVWLNAKVYQGLRFFSDVSFGIFLVHDFLRMALVRLGVDALFFPPILAVPVLSLVVFVVSGLIVYCLKKIPKVGSYIVGN